MLTTETRFNSDYWAARAASYPRLSWVNDERLLQPFQYLASLEGKETCVDVGVGSGAIANYLAKFLSPQGRVVGFDISFEMLGLIGDRQELHSPQRLNCVANVYNLPLGDGQADVVTARMILHHLTYVDKALREMWRITVPGGRLIISEYIASAPEILEFERAVFNLKESGRHVWTGSQLTDQIQTSLGLRSVTLTYATLPQYSLRNWLSGNGTSSQAKDAITDLYRKAPETVLKAKNITSTPNGDILFDAKFAFVLSTKN